MPLSQADLEAIRLIVREEIASVRRSSAEPSCSSTRETSRHFDPDPDEDATQALREMGRALIAALDGEPCAAEEELRADAYYRSRYDESWIKRAKAAREVASDAPVSDEEMMVFMKRNRKIQAERSERRRAKKLAKPRPGKA